MVPHRSENRGFWNQKHSDFNIKTCQRKKPELVGTKILTRFT